MVITDPTQQDATALLLDFRKAYDSLDREYMLEVLRRKGYPEKFIRAVDAMHDGTTVRFLANGYTSRSIAVTSGIRQGCPLAPLLFILALDPLYRKLDGFMGIRGVIIQSEAGRFELRVAGYADDTAAFVRNPADIPILMRDLSIFGNASGLQINAGKTSDCAPPTWSATRHHLTTESYVSEAESRLQKKSLTVDQRSLIAGAVIIPNLLYIARHAWPSTEDVNTMDTRIRNYVWHGQFATDLTGVKAWLDADLAALPRTDRGLAIPDLRAELYAMAATTVSKWAEMGTKNLHIAGDILYHGTKPGLAPKVYITPDYTPATPTGFRRRRTMWRTGRRLLAETGAPEPEADCAMKALARCAYQIGGISTRWEGEKLWLDCTELLERLAGTTAYKERMINGCANVEWLPFAEANIVQAHTRDGIRTTLAKASGLLLTEGTLISDVVTWTRLEKGELVFKFAKKSIQQELRQQGENLVTIIIANYVELALRRPFPQEVHFTATPATHPVIAELRNGEEVELLIKDSVTGPTTIRPITNHEGMKSALTRFMAPDATVHAVHPHPHLSRLVCSAVLTKVLGTLWPSGKSFGTRTNNPLERFNRVLNTRFPTPHPSMATFVTVIKQISAEYVQQLNDIPRGRARRVPRETIELPTAVDLPEELENAGKFGPASTLSNNASVGSANSVVAL
ncbi:unnamed protein product [Phytophthora fragariaefolia]|uniref:Unnamed protein product n=1 Tax=Phytophthora fragariaefolia TaxID=1490495 RepID=A0A9W7CRI2_9STRA|nr:unnamed protein product [Phytophthora fragariaefolia]